uniref:Histidine-containing phosphotransfer protein n=1 Tax=Anthurium amnicola TaxID=1678845 RepID=A0A1D1ZBV2_9ARAE
MAAATHKDQLNGLVNSMFVEGLLDDQFTQIQMLQDANNPGFIAEVITLFCEDAERLLNELTKLLEQPAVDYNKVDAYVHQLKGSSSSVGASHVKQGCIEFRQFCEENNKEGCLHTLNLVKHEYFRLRSKFEVMVQLEQRIQAYDSKQQ